MKKNRIAIIFMFFLIFTVPIYNPIKSNTKTEEIKSPKTSSSPITLRYGTDAAPTSLDPHYAFDSNSFDVIDQVVETLFAYDLSDPELNIVPRLAAGFGTWDVDGLNYRVSLKQGITFHDGLEFNAYAVEWNFARLAYFLDLSGSLPEETPRSLFYYVYVWPDGEPIINSVNIINNYEVEFVLNRKYAPFEALLSFSGSSIMSPASTPPEDYIDLVTGDLVGTGPFVYDEYIDLEVNFHGYRNYWAGAPDIDQLTFLIIPDSTARATALLGNEIDFLSTTDNTIVEDVEGTPNIVIEEGQGANVFYIAMNNNNLNQTMRQAVSYAIDYDYIIDDIMQGNAARLKSPIPEGIRYADWSYEVATLDIQGARQILVEGGVVDHDITDNAWWEGRAINNPIATYTYGQIYTSASSVSIGNKLLETLKEIGISLSIESFSFAELIQLLIDNPDTVDLFYMGWGPDINDPHNYIQLFDNNTFYYNLAQVNDSYLQDLIDQGVSELDSLSRETTYNEIQRYLVEELMPWAYLFVNLRYIIYWDDFFGFQWNPMGKVWFHSVNYEQYIEVSPLNYDFGEVELGTSESIIITISNIGAGNLDIIDINFKTGSSVDFSIIIPTIPITIPSSSFIEIEVIYDPSQLGSGSAILEIDSSDPNKPIIEVQLYGRTQIVSNWLTNEVIINGLEDTDEWTDAISYNILLYHAWGWPNPKYQQSDKVLTIRFKNDGEWLYLFYEIPWSGPESPPEAGGIAYHQFSGNPNTDSDSGWTGLYGGTVDYYGWDGANWLNDILDSGQNDVEGMGSIDSNIYRFEFRKRLDSEDGLDWSLTPGETVGNPNLSLPPYLYIQLWDEDSSSVYQQSIALHLMRSETIIIYEDFTLTSDIYFEAGNGIVIGDDGITINGMGYKIIGSGSGSGITITNHESVTIKNLIIQEFKTGISIYEGKQNKISGNYISDNKIGIILSSTLNEVTNNIITRNTWWGIFANGSSNGIYRNLLINNQDQILDGLNIWVDPINNVGNFWSNYWGEDLDGDYIGDTDLPHEGVDDAPLLDPSIPEFYGPLLYADWWMTGRGGSPIIFQAEDPYGRIINANVNEIGLNAFYIENEDWVEGEDSVMILIAINPEEPIFGTYTYEITATEDTTYSMEWFSSAESERLFEQAVEDVPLTEGQTDQIGTVIEEVEDPAPGDPPVIVHSEDQTSPEVNAEVVPIYSPDDIVKFRVEFSATDDTDSDPTITPLLKLPLPEDLSMWKVKFKVRSGLKFKIGDKNLMIIAPNPSAIWNQIQDLGGVLVQNEQIINIIIDDMDGCNCEVLLEVTAMDASGNINTAISALNFGDDDDDDDD